MSPAQPSRDAVIDLLRGLSIVSVMVLHFALAYGIADSWLGDLVPPPWLKRWVFNGNYGVTVFFVVSGYVITRGVLQRDGSLGALRATDFLGRRAARILPLLLVAMGVATTLGLAGVAGFTNDDGGVHRPLSFWWPAVASVVLSWHNQLMQSEGYFNYVLNVYWSLSVEEMFYLGFALLCVALRTHTRVVLVCAALIAFGPVYRALHADNEIAYLYAYGACFDAIAMGVLCALAEAHGRVPLGGAWAARAGRMATGLAVLLACAVWLLGFGEHPALGPSMMAASTAAIIVSSRAWAPADAWRVGRVWRWLGQRSYELYLFHIIVLALLRLVWTRPDLTHATRLPLLLGYGVFSVLVAEGARRWIGEPARRFVNSRLESSAHGA